MQRRLSISITNTESRSSGLFSRTFIVPLTKVYNFKVTLDFSDHYFSSKRFSELYAFSQLLKPYILKYDFPMPDFPSKKLSHSKHTIQRRKEKIQDWLQKLSYCPKFTKKMCRFFSISEEKLATNSKEFDQDDFYVREFLEMLENEKNQKLNILKIFSMKFLARRRKVVPSTVKMLLENLIPLCEVPLLTGICLDLLSKLMTREYFSEYLLVAEEFCKLDSGLLARMHLEQVLVRGKCGELQALELLNVLRNSQHSEKLLEILNNQFAALEVFTNWDKDCVRPVIRQCVNVNNNLVVLYNSEYCKISYLNSGNNVDVHVSLNLYANKDKVIELVTNPAERAKWDLKLKMMKTDQDLCVFEFLHNKDKFLAKCQASFDSSQNFCKVNYSDIEESGFTSEICIESEEQFNKKDESMSGSANITCATYVSCKEFDEDYESLKVLIKYSCKGKWVKLFSDDILHESKDLIKSVKRFKTICENSDIGEFSKQECMLDTICSRKFLNRSVLF